MMTLAVTLVLLYTTCAFATFNPEDVVSFEEALEICKDHHPIPPNILDRVMDGEPVNDENFNCFAACVLDSLHLFNSDNSLNIDSAISKLPDDAEFKGPLIEAIKECGVLRDDDKCKTAYLLFMCMHEKNIPKLVMG